MGDERQELAGLLRDRAQALRRIVRDQLRPYEMELFTALTAFADDLEAHAEQLERPANRL